MRKMKNSGVEWIGDIPENWDTSKMKHIGQYINGYAFKPEDWGSVGKRIIRIQDLTRFNDNPNYFSGDIDKKYLVKSGDILVSWAATLDAFIWKQEDSWLNQHIFKALPNNKVVKYDYFYWLIKEAMQNMANENLHGIMMQHVTLGLFGNYAIPLPNLEEQQRIADFLNQTCAEIDTVIEKTKATIEKYKKLKQSVITEAVTKGIRGNRPMKDSGIEWIGNICANYGLWRMKFLLREPLMYGANESGVSYEDALPRYIRITDITLDGKLKDTGKLSLTEEIAEPYILADNDVLFARSGGTVGKAFIYKKEYGKSAFAGYLIKASVNDTLSADYLFYYTQSSLYEEWKKQIFVQATIQNIGADRYNNLPIVLPPIGEQKEIVIYLDNKCAEIDALIAKKTTLLTELETYKKSLIYEYVTGKKEVGENTVSTQVAVYSPYFPVIIKVNNLYNALKAFMFGILDKCNYDTGRVKLEKMMFVAQHSIGFDLGNEYSRAELGPLDSLFYQCEYDLVKDGCIIKDKKRNIRRIYYKAGRNNHKYKEEYNRYFADCDTEIDRIINIFKDYDVQKSERIATLFGAWNDAIIDKRQFTDENIVEDVLNNWHEHKGDYSRKEWLEDLEEMKKFNLIPKGYGKKTVIKNDTM